MLRPVFIFLLVLIISGPGMTPGSASEKNILVFAAASMKNALEEIGAKYSEHCGCRITFSFAGSGTLARQIRAGAKADVFVSADEAWVKWLAEHQAIDPDAITNIAGNNLVMAIGKDQIKASDLPFRLPDQLADYLIDKRIAMSDIDSVPAGRYGKQALDHLDLWKMLAPRLVFGENVRITLRMAARGDVDAAIVYESDIAIEPAVEILYRFKPDVHQPIVYPSVLIGQNQLAGEFQQFMTSDTARDIFTKLGFRVPADG